MFPRLLAGFAGLILITAACSDGQPDTQTAAADAAATQAAPAAPAQQPVTIDVLASASDLGDILVGPSGRTLYAFTNDVEASSTCYGTCADAWPPILVSADWTAGPGLDFGIFATTVRDDGQQQLVAGKWPLYYFAGDAGPGDHNGQGSGDVWFAVDLNGQLITDLGSADAAPTDVDDAATTDEAVAQTVEPVVSIAANDLGDVLVDSAGFTLYGFLDDSDGVSTCNNACADAWPPLTVNGTELPPGLDPQVFSLVARDDGSMQLKAGKWPLYRFAGDTAPGETSGQGSGGVWFVAAPDGGLIGSGGESMTDSDY